MRNNIKWSAAEFAAVLAEAYRIQSANGVLHPRFLWPKAEQVLDGPRQRHRFHSALVAKLNKRYHAWKDQARQAGLLSELKATEPKTTETEGPEPRIVIVEKPVMREPDWGRIPTLELARELLTRLAALEDISKKFDSLVDILKARTEVEVRHQPDTALRQAIRPPAPVKALRVLVIGPMEGQQNDIDDAVKKLPKPVELRYWNSSHTAQSEVPMTTDYALVTKHASHAIWDKARAALDNDRVFFINGGKTGIIQKLYDLCSRQ